MQNYLRQTAIIYKAETYRVMGFVLCTPIGKLFLDFMSKELSDSIIFNLINFISSITLMYMGLSLIHNGESLLLDKNSIKLQKGSDNV